MSCLDPQTLGLYKCVLEIEALPQEKDRQSNYKIVYIYKKKAGKKIGTLLISSGCCEC